MNKYRSKTKNYSSVRFAIAFDNLSLQAQLNKHQSEKSGMEEHQV